MMAKVRESPFCEPVASAMTSSKGNLNTNALPPGLVGAWELARLEGQVPLFGLMKATGSVIILAGDGSCQADLKIRLGGWLPVPALPRHLQGTYCCPTETTVRFEGTWNGHKESLTYQFSIAENTLALKSSMGYRLLLHRRTFGDG
jgi:hypothetical protein